MGPIPSPEQVKLIDELGGATKVAAYLTEHFQRRTPLRPQSVSAWKTRGIPFAYRAALAIWANQRAVSVPSVFLNELPSPTVSSNVCTDSDDVAGDTAHGSDVPGWIDD